MKENYDGKYIKTKITESLDKTNLKKYMKSEAMKEYKKEYMKEYHKSDKYKEYKKEYNNKQCLYNNEKLTLSALSTRFRRSGIENPTKEAKKYLLK